MGTLAANTAARDRQVWVYATVASLALPIYGLLVWVFAPGIIGRHYLWIYMAMPAAGAVGGICAISGMIALSRLKARRWIWMLSSLGFGCSVAASLFGLAALVFMGIVFGPVYVSPSFITTEAGLANIPATASEVEALHKNGLDVIWYFLKFKAPEADIERFVQESESIKQPPRGVFDANNIYAPFRLSKDKLEETMDWDWRYWAYSQNIPWFEPDITVKGRLYDFKRERRWGIVVVDDDKNEVYIFFSYSGLGPDDRQELLEQKGASNGQ